MQSMFKSECLLIAVSISAFYAHAVEDPSTLQTNAHRSVFVTDPAFGKDPFFPKSARRPLSKPKPEPTDASVQTPRFLDGIQLKGISLGAGRRLALLNYYTLAEGEQADLRIDGQVVPVHCVEIKERSVVVNVKGIKTELQLREGL